MRIQLVSVKLDPSTGAPQITYVPFEKVYQGGDKIVDVTMGQARPAKTFKEGEPGYEAPCHGCGVINTLMSDFRWVNNDGTLHSCGDNGKGRDKWTLPNKDPRVDIDMKAFPHLTDEERDMLATAIQERLEELLDNDVDPLRYRPEYSNNGPFTLADDEFKSYHHVKLDEPPRTAYQTFDGDMSEFVDEARKETVKKARKAKQVRDHNLKERDISGEALRIVSSYDQVSGKRVDYEIVSPQKLFYYDGSSTFRILDDAGVVHLVPAPGYRAAIHRWIPRINADPVQF